ERICAHLASSSEAAAGSVRVVSRWTERKGPDCSRTGVSQGSFTGDLQHARRAGSPTPSSASSPRLGPLNLSTRDRSPQAERHIAARPAAPPRAPLRPSHRSAPPTAPPFGVERTFCTGRDLIGSTALTPRQRQEVRSAPPV